MNNLYKIEVKKEGSEIVSVAVYHPNGTLLTTVDRDWETILKFLTTTQCPL